MARCHITSKSTRSGNNVSHACNRTKRTFKPNVHKRWLALNLSAKPTKIMVSKKGLRYLDSANFTLAHEELDRIIERHNQKT